MLTGNLVRVRHARNRLVPLYLNAHDAHWLRVAEELLAVFRAANQRTRGELEEELEDLVGDGTSQLVHRGLAKLLEDRCEFEVAADVPPDQVREVVFRIAAEHHARVPFDRYAALEAARQELGITAEQVDHALFADLKDEQRLLKFDDCPPEFLLNRYNVALAQAIVLRSTKLEVQIYQESPARLRKLFRSVKFHRLICTIDAVVGSVCRLSFDGPLSLFSSTQKYGLQLANFLPSILQCKAFDLRADVRWGAEKKEKKFELSGTDGLKSHLPDFGMHIPREITNFADNFRATVTQWTLDDDPNPMVVEGSMWVPDFTLTHRNSGKQVYVEILGFWRKIDIEKHYCLLKRALPGQFVLVVSEQYRTDEEGEFALGEGVYRFKRTPIAEEVAKMAASVANA